MSKLSITIIKAIQPDIDKWRESDLNHVVIFDITPDSATWSFCSSGDTPEGCDTVSIVREGGYFRIKYNTNTKYIITKHGDIFINSYTVGSNVVSDSAIRKALETVFSNLDSTDTIFRNEIFDTIRDWAQRHINGVNVHADEIALDITKNGNILSTIDIRSAINNARAKCVKINGSILAIWSGNEWITSNDQLTCCTGKLSFNEVGCLQDVIVNIKPKEEKPDSTEGGTSMICYSDLTQIIYSWANELNDVGCVNHEMESDTDRFVISFNNGKTLTVGCSVISAVVDEVWINEPNNTFCTIRNNSEIRDYFTYNSYGFHTFVFTSLRKFIRDFKIKDFRDKIIKAIDDGIKEWLSHLNSSFSHDREDVKGVTPAYDGIKYTIYKVEPTQASRFYLTIGHTSTIDLFVNDKSIFYCNAYENGVQSFAVPPNIPYISYMTKEEFTLLIDYVKKRVDALNKKPEPKISTMDSSEQKPDSTDEQLLESSNVKSFDELWEMWEAANNKYTPDESFELWMSVAAKHTVPPLPSMPGGHSLKFDIHNQTVDLKSLNNATEQRPNRNRQMMNRIRPIIIKWLKDVVDSPSPFSSFEEVSATESASLKYSFILHGDRDANISMEIPFGFIGTMFISHDGVNIMRIGPDDVVLLMPFINIDPDIQINRLHHLLYETMIIKRRRSKIDEIIKCITFFIRSTWPDIQYSIVGRHINIIKRSVASDAPVGSIRIGFSYKPGYLLTIWQDNDYDHPLIEFDDKWKPVMFDPQDKFTRKMYSWLSVNFGEEEPDIISDALDKSICRSDKVVPIKFTPRTHNFKSWASIRFTEAANLKAMPEDAELIMKIVKERNNMIKIPGIKNVLFNDTKRTTTVLFDDGTITMSKSMDTDTYDHEVGFAMCIMKKMYGNRTRFQKEIKRWTAACENANKKIADKAARKQDKNVEEDTVS